VGGNLHELRDTAINQLGLITRDQALVHGFTDHAIWTRVWRGDWTPLHAGVFTMDVSPPRWEARVLASIFACGAPAAASHRTASVLYGLDGVSGSMIELTVKFGGLPIPRDAIVHRTRRRLEPTMRAGIPVVPIERTLLDLASQLPAITLEKAVMSAIRKGLTTPDLIAVTLSEQGGRGVRGTKKLKRVLLLTDDGITGAPSEVDAFSLIRDAPIPQPILQHPIRLPDDSNAYPDFAWPPRMKIVEIDGMDGHGSADQLHADLKRQNQLMQLGWELRRFSARSLQREPESVIREIVKFVNDV